MSDHSHPHPTPPPPSSLPHLPPHPDQDQSIVQEALDKLSAIRKSSLNPSPAAAAAEFAGVGIKPGAPGSQSIPNSQVGSRVSSRPTTPGVGVGPGPGVSGGLGAMSMSSAGQPEGQTGLASDGSTSLHQMGLLSVDDDSSPTTTAHLLASKGLTMSSNSNAGSLSTSPSAAGAGASVSAPQPISHSNNAPPTIVSTLNHSRKFEEGSGSAGMGAPLTALSSLTSPAPGSHGANSTTGVFEDDSEGVLTPEEARARSVPSTPHFGAQTGMLKTLDESTKLLRSKSKSKMPTRAPSVSGIGNLVEKPDYSEAKIVVAMVGLPARGKSYLSNRLMRYLRWLEYKVEVFNVGQLRRSRARDLAQKGGTKQDHSASYFSHSNQQASALREQLANDSLEMLITWLKTEGGNVAIHDATNSTIDRRSKIKARIAKEPNLHLLFLESYCDDAEVIATNIALKVSSGDPDYAGMSKEDAERDFRKRIEQYESVYQTITEPELSFCKILNVGRQVVINRIDGYLQSRIAFYLMNLHLKPRSIYLSRHGESMHNVGGMIGGDSPLSPRGEKYATLLPALVTENIGKAPLTVWTSTLQRTVQTARFLPYPKKTWKSLDELDAGVCDGMTYEEIAEKYPEDYESRDDDKFNYRYRGGESYRDVVVRLEPVIMELERQRDVFIIGHQAIIRCLYGYFMGLSQEEIPYIQVPLHTLIKLTPVAYGCKEERYPLPIAAVNTHRPKPAKKTHPEMTSALDTTARDYFGVTSKMNSPLLNPNAATHLPEVTLPDNTGTATATKVDGDRDAEAERHVNTFSDLKDEPVKEKGGQDSFEHEQTREPTERSQDAAVAQDESAAKDNHSSQLNQEDPNGEPQPSSDQIALALATIADSRSAQPDSGKYEDFDLEEVVGNLCTNSEERKNSRKIFCPRQGCGSCILNVKVAKLVEGDGSLLPQDPDAPFPPDPVPSNPAKKEDIYYWHVEGSPFAFDNIGFTRSATAVKENGPKIKWLICAECDLGPLGYSYEGGKEAWVGVGRVKYAPA